METDAAESKGKGCRLFVFFEGAKELSSFLPRRRVQPGRLTRYKKESLRQRPPIESLPHPRPGLFEVAPEGDLIFQPPQRHVFSPFHPRIHRHEGRHASDEHRLARREASIEEGLTKHRRLFDRSM